MFNPQLLSYPIKKVVLELGPIVRQNLPGEAKYMMYILRYAFKTAFAVLSGIGTHQTHPVSIHITVKA